MKRIYLDNSATTSVNPRVKKDMQKYFSQMYGNASSLHYFGRQSKIVIENSRIQIAKFLNANPNEIFFTSCGTEANNIAILGILRAYGKIGHVVSSVIEHHSVLHTCEYLNQNGHMITYIKVDKNGIISVKDLINSLRDNTILLTVMHANNEIGSIQPIEDIAYELNKINANRKHKIYFHTDAVQTAGKIDIDVKKLGIDLLTISAHKLHGPKGIGILYIKNGTKILPIMFGGHHENGIRPGTENVSCIVGCAKACEVSYNNLNEHYEHVSKLRKKLEEGILNTITDVTINAGNSNVLANILNVSFKYIEGESLLLMLDMKGIAVSTGSACTSDASSPSHVLTAIGLSPILARSSIRFSFTYQNTITEIDYVLSVLPKLVNDLRLMSPIWKRNRKLI
jgi:cysteine desulfurase